jgi:5-methylthioadenosine/S-adenosylhomocysteine deaminase
VHDRFREADLIRTAFTPHAPYSVSDATFSRVRTLADELDIPVHTHIQETAGEVADSVREFGERPLARLDRLGLLNHRLMAVHMVHIDDGEIARMAECAASVVHCPKSNLKLASGFCPVQRLLDAGVNVAIGSDGAASNNDLDVHGEMRTAALLANSPASLRTWSPWTSAASRASRCTIRSPIWSTRAVGIRSPMCGSRAGPWSRNRSC